MTLRDVFARAELEARQFPEIRDVVQFGSIGCLEQYRVPFQQTLRYLPRPSTVLDWGYGAGHWSFTLRELGHTIEAFGLWREEGCTAALENGPRFNLTIGDTSEPRVIPYPSASFDAVFSIGVLEHVWECGGSELDSMIEIRRVLKPGGLFPCYHFPNHRSWIEKTTREGQGRYKHKYLYTKEDVQRFCRDSGFELLDLRLYNVLPRRILNRMPGKRNPVVASAYNALDSVLGLAFRRYSQN